jgi:succinoglycan biosynthesis protein ExoL
VLHGSVHHHAIPEFDAVLAARENMTWFGPYDYPDGLSEIYQSCDLIWSQDLWQWGTNSTWLLPNRIYEASYFGCPSLAVEGSETGRRVADGLGWTISAPEATALVALLETLLPVDVASQRRVLLERPETDFRQTLDDVSASLRLATEKR